MKGFTSLLQYFKEHNWRFEADESRLLLRTSFRMKNVTLGCLAWVSHEDDLVQFVSSLPVVVQHEKVPAIAEVCVRASSQLKLGRFQLNVRDGALQFHTSLPYPKGDLQGQLLTRLIGANLSSADFFFPAFTRVLYCAASPAEALRQVVENINQTKGRAGHDEPPPPSRIQLN